MKWDYLDKEGTGNEGNDGCKAQDTNTPEKPENAIVDGRSETGFLLARFPSPTPLAFLPLTSDRPPDTLEARRDFAQ